MSIYYNDCDPFCIEWLERLIKRGHLPAGDVDSRPIQEVHPDDVKGYTHAHFFAGIGGWTLALRLAGWEATQPVWTGSCPCQPFSVAGKNWGTADTRHLWPAWFHLIRECQPPVVLGEQVAGAIGHGWWDAVQANLEAEGYACGMAVLGAHSVGAPHLRQRLWFVADSPDSERRRREQGAQTGARSDEERGWRPAGGGPSGSIPGGMADGVSEGLEGFPRDADDWRQSGWEHAAQAGPAAPCSPVSPLGDPGRDERGRREAVGGADDGSAGTAEEDAGAGQAGTHQAGIGAESQPADDGTERYPWEDVEWLPCRDGKLRPTQPGLFPLAHGVPGRMGRLRAYGNAIVPQVAATFIEAYLGRDR